MKFNFSIFNKIIEIFYPEITVSTNTFIKGSINSDTNDFKLDFDSPEIIAFDNLTQAKNELKKIKNWRIFDKSQIDDTEKYSAYLLVKLDQTKLPKQLQADITSNQEWQLASKQFQWTFVNKK